MVDDDEEVADGDRRHTILEAAQQQHTDEFAAFCESVASGTADANAADFYVGSDDEVMVADGDEDDASSSSSTLRLRHIFRLVQNH